MYNPNETFFNSFILKVEGFPVKACVCVFVLIIMLRQSAVKMYYEDIKLDLSRLHFKATFWFLIKVTARFGLGYG